MSAFDVINLAKLPAPAFVETLDAEAVLAEMRDQLVALMPEIEPALSLESEPALKILEICAYREVLLRARVNDAGRAVMLALATGADLDNLGALMGVERLVNEADDAYRTRIQLSLEGFSTAGPIGGYVFWGLSASPEVKDISIASPAPGEVLVTLLSNTGDGIPDAALLTTVTTALNDEDVRPLTDQVTVQAVAIQNFAIDATLTLYEGPDSALVLAAAEAAVATWVAAHHRLGHDITQSGLFAALHQAGVQNVTLTAPAADLIIADYEAAYCTGITVAIGGRDV